MDGSIGRCQRVDIWKFWSHYKNQDRSRLKSRRWNINIATFLSWVEWVLVKWSNNTFTGCVLNITCRRQLGYTPSLILRHLVIQYQWWVIPGKAISDYTQEIFSFMVFELKLRASALKVICPWFGIWTNSDVVTYINTIFLMSHPYNPSSDSLVVYHTGILIDIWRGVGPLIIICHGT